MSGWNAAKGSIISAYCSARPRVRQTGVRLGFDLSPTLGHPIRLTALGRCAAEERDHNQTNISGQFES